MKKLDHSFYDRDDVVLIAKELLGKILITNKNGIITSGRIVETEAYNGVIDKASHAYGGRRTKRTEVMFGKAGTAYVYLCYGIHFLFNVVTNTIGIPHAVLIRGIDPMEGIADMLIRTGKPTLDSTLTRGPGNVSKALGITTADTVQDLLGETIFIADDGFLYEPAWIGKSERIGVDYAAEDALLHYRFYIRGNRFVSGKKTT